MKTYRACVALEGRWNNARRIARIVKVEFELGIEKKKRTEKLTGPYVLFSFFGFSWRG